MHLNRKPFVSCRIQYQQYLQDIYLTNTHETIEFVSRNRPEHPIDLVLIHKDKKETVDSTLQGKQYLHGRVDHIQKEKNSVIINQK